MNVKGTKKKNQVVNVMEQQELLKKAERKCLSKICSKNKNY